MISTQLGLETDVNHAQKNASAQVISRAQREWAAALPRGFWWYLDLGVVVKRLTRRVYDLVLIASWRRLVPQEPIDIDAAWDSFAISSRNFDHYDSLPQTLSGPESPTLPHAGE